MDLKEFKQLVRFARKSGIKSAKFNGFEFEFQDKVPFPKPRGLKTIQEITKAPKQAQVEPTFDEINQYIYGNTDLETA